MNTARAHRGLLALLITFLALDVTGTEVVEAVWKPQRTTFRFSSNSTSYACAELERKVRNVLIVLGAHESIRMDRSECSPHTGVSMDITFMSPIEATQDNVRAVSTFSTEDELIARLQGIELPAAEDVARFPATWQIVSLSMGRPSYLRAGDCELIEHIRRQLMPHLAVRDIPRQLMCVPGSLAARPPRIIVSALVARAR